MKIDVKIIDERLKQEEFFPTNSPANAGTDLRACISEELVLAPGSGQKISSGIAVAIPEGFFGLIVPRSGMGSKGLHVKHTCGVIDASYRGPIMLNVINNGEDFIRISKLDRIMQLLILPVQHVTWNAVESLDETCRNAGGYGSTGVK